MANLPITMVNNADKIISAFNKQVENGLKSIGLEAEKYAKGEVPTDTGRLKNSINWAIRGACGPTGDNPIGEAEVATVYIGTNVEYAPYIEYGTGIYAESGQGRQTPWWYKDSKGNWHMTRGNKPTRFLRNAASTHAARYQELMREALEK